MVAYVLRVGASSAVNYTLTAAVGAFALAGQAATLTSSAATWQLASGHYEPADITMEIIAPRASLSTANRYYKQYPGVPYEVPISVLGGAPPFRYELTAAPSGMAVGETLPSDVEANGPGNYGVITWANPTTSGSPHTVSIRVTDQEGTVATVSYTLTVDTTLALFIDSVNGSDGNPGTLGSPKQTIHGWYGANKAASTYSGYFIYYRAGTYTTATDAIEAGNDSGQRMPMPDHKPKVHIGYPGETVNLTVSGGVWIWYGNSTGNIWGSNLTFGTVASGGDHRAWSFDSGINDIVLYKPTFAEPTTNGPTGANPSLVMSRAAGTSTYITLNRMTVLGTNGHDIFLGYGTSKVVVEWTNIANNKGGASGSAHGFYAKIGNDKWSVRYSRGISGNDVELLDFDAYSPGGTNLEAIFNLYKTTGLAVRGGPNTGGTFGPIYDKRNTWLAPYSQAENISAGTWNATRNVVVHDGSKTQGYGLSSSSVTINRTSLLAATSGLVDSSGLLTGTDRTTYLGIRGHEVA